jgi:hypothetical protein
MITRPKNALLVEVPEQLACPRFNCNTNHRVSCSAGWRAAAGKIAFPELRNGIDERRLANPTPCGIRQDRDQLFRSHNAESRMEHPAFAKHLQGMVAGVRFELTTFGL